MLFMNVSVKMLTSCVHRFTGGAGGKGVWGAAGMVYEDEEPDVQDPNYDESAQVGCKQMFLFSFIQTPNLFAAVCILLFLFF